MKFKYGQRVKIVGDGFYEGCSGSVIEFITTGNCYRVLLFPPDWISASYFTKLNPPATAMFFENEIEVIEL